MPIYEYRCQNCEDLVEAWQKLNDEPVRDCVKCGELGTMVRTMSTTSFALKGTGWYTTDYKGQSSKKD